MRNFSRRARGAMPPAFLLGDTAIALAVTALLGLVVFVVLWSCGLLGLLAPEAPPRPPDADDAAPFARPVVGRLRPPSADELVEQRARCATVRERCEPAIRTLVAHDTNGGVDALRDALSLLHAVVDENERDGSLGVIASTELCNALVKADALRTLEQLQQHDDAAVARSSSVVFTHVIPRIWSF